MDPDLTIDMDHEQPANMIDTPMQAIAPTLQTWYTVSRARSRAANTMGRHGVEEIDQQVAKKAPSKSLRRIGHC